jgi:hypothetical protein
MYPGRLRKPWLMELCERSDEGGMSASLEPNDNDFFSGSLPHSPVMPSSLNLLDYLRDF